DAEAARAFGRVAASLRGSGRKVTARAYDAMIAAIAVANDLPIYTCNPVDFMGIDGLEVVAVPFPDTT
ncbi:MAG: PIN domain-containing protein, partial [Solirubrobacteraceae bacterium]